MAAEKNFENRLKKYLDQKGVWYIKYWAGAKFTKEGIPDILACINGRFYGIEVKAPNGKPTMVQLVTLKKIDKAGGYGLLLYPEDFEDFKTWLNAGSPTTSTFYRRNLLNQSNWFKKLMG